MDAAISHFIFTFKALIRETPHAKVFSLVMRAEAFSELSENFGLCYKYHLGVTWPTLAPRQTGKMSLLGRRREWGLSGQLAESALSMFILPLLNNFSIALL